MQQRSENSTATAILDVAVKLFSEKGPDAVGIREIASTVGVQPNTVTYHFKTKDNLRRCTLAHALEHGVPMEEIVARYAQAPVETPQDKADALAAIVIDVFTYANGPAFNRTSQLIAYAILGNDAEQKHMFIRAFDEAEKSLLGYLGEIGFDLTEHQTRFFTYYFWSQIYFWTVGQEMILADLEVEDIPADFVQTFGAGVGRTCCMMLGLPEPTQSQWGDLC